MIIVGPSDRYTPFGGSYLSTISNTLSLNPCNFNWCHSPRSQLHPPSKFCRILQHTCNSVPRGHHSYARTRDIMNYLWQSHMQGRSKSTHFSVFCTSGPERELVIQPYKCLEFFRCVEISTCIWFHSRYVGLNQPPILASLAYLDKGTNIRELGVWRIHLIWCTWPFQNHNNKLASIE